VLRTVNRILRASLAQTDTKKADKYAKLAEKYAKLGKAAKQYRRKQSDYDPDWAQKLNSLSTSRHLSTRNISSKSLHAFLSNLAHKQTDRQTKVGMWAKTYTSSFVRGKLACE